MKIVPGPPLGNLPDAQYMRSARVTMYSCFVTKTYYSPKRIECQTSGRSLTFDFLTPIRAKTISVMYMFADISPSRICLQASQNDTRLKFAKKDREAHYVRDKLNYERRLHLKILSNILHGL